MKNCFVKMALVFSGAYTLASWALSVSVESSRIYPNGQIDYMRTTTDSNGNQATSTTGSCGREIQPSCGDACGCQCCESINDYDTPNPAVDPEGGCSGTDSGTVGGTDSGTDSETDSNYTDPTPTSNPNDSDWY